MISALIKGRWPQIGRVIELQQLELITSVELIDEFIDVTTRPSKLRLLEPVEAEAIANLLRRVTLIAPIRGINLCRDPNDDFLLGLAAASNADVLVTRDEDLLTLGRFGRTEIVSVSKFFQRLQSELHE